MASYTNLKTFEEHLQDSGFAFTDREEKLAREFFERGIQHEKGSLAREQKVNLDNYLDPSCPKWAFGNKE